jgi:hypothetical protein
VTFEPSIGLVEFGTALVLNEARRRLRTLKRRA